MRVVVSEYIEADPHAVFAAASDFAGAAGVIEDIIKVEMLTEGEVGVGTRFRETRRMFGKEAVEVMEVATFEPEHGRYTLTAASRGAEYLTEVRCIPERDGTRVQCDFQGKAAKPVARLMSAVTSPLFKGVVKKALAKDLAQMKRHVEGAAAGNG